MAIDRHPGGGMTLTGPHINLYRLAAALSTARTDIRTEGRVKFRWTRNGWLALAAFMEQPAPKSRKQKAALLEAAQAKFDALKRQTPDDAEYVTCDHCGTGEQTGETCNQCGAILPAHD